MVCSVRPAWSQGQDGDRWHKLGKDKAYGNKKHILNLDGNLVRTEYSWNLGVHMKKIELRDEGREIMNWIQVVQDRVQL
jgi:hypothetical protein